MDMIKSAYKQFREDAGPESNKCFLLTEITMDNLLSDGDLDEKDFLDRADLLCELGQTVVISSCTKQQKLINYFKDYKIKKLGLVTGVRELLEMINNTYYQHLLESSQIKDIKGFKEEVLHIFSQQVLQMIKENEKGWEKLVPSKVAKLIKEKCLFGFPYEQMEFEY